MRITDQSMYYVMHYLSFPSFSLIHALEKKEKNICSENWAHFRSTNSCIRAIPETMDWHQARNFCKYHHNGDLAIVESRELDDFISSESRFFSTSPLHLFLVRGLFNFEYASNLQHCTVLQLVRLHWF